LIWEITRQKGEDVSCLNMDVKNSLTIFI